MEHTVSLIYGSVRTERQGIRLVRYLSNKMQGKNWKVHVIDPIEYKLPLLDKMYKEYTPGTAPEALEKLAEMLRSSDGFLAVTGEYNHTLPPALINLLDHFQSEYLFKPSAIASYSAGQFAGVRASVHARVVLGELGCPAISSILPVPKVGETFDADGNLQADYLDKRTNRFLDEFAWYIRAMKTERAKRTPF